MSTLRNSGRKRRGLSTHRHLSMLESKPGLCSDLPVAPRTWTAYSTALAHLFLSMVYQSYSPETGGFLISKRTVPESMSRILNLTKSIL